MGRIPGVPAERAGLIQRLVYWMTRRRFTQVPEPMMVSANHPWVFRAYVGFEYGLDKATRVDKRTKALAGIKAAALVGCPF